MRQLKTRLFSIKVCTRREQRFVRFLRMMLVSLTLEDAAKKEAENLRLSAEAMDALCRLMIDLKTLVPPLYILAPSSGWVTTDELNLLTALRGAKPGHIDGAATLLNVHAARHLSLINLVIQAGQLIKGSDVVLGARPLMGDATDAQKIAPRSRKIDLGSTISAR